MVPHLDTVCAIHDLERQHRLAEASRVHSLLSTSQPSFEVVRRSAGIQAPATLVRRLLGMIKLGPTVAPGLPS